LQLNIQNLEAVIRLLAHDVDPRIGYAHELSSMDLRATLVLVFGMRGKAIRSTPGNILIKDIAGEQSYERN
jgi:hypothetical protein